MNRLMTIAWCLGIVLTSFDSHALGQKGNYIDFDTNEILFQKNADQRIDPASMTKIMTEGDRDLNLSFYFDKEKEYVAFDIIKNYSDIIKNYSYVPERRNFAQFNFKTIEEAKEFESKIENLSNYSEIVNFAKNNNIIFIKGENFSFWDLVKEISVPLFKLAPNQKSKIIENSSAKTIVILESINHEKESLKTLETSNKCGWGGTILYLEYYFDIDGFKHIGKFKDLGELKDLWDQKGGFYCTYQ